jgi:hypothetical protein
MLIGFNFINRAGGRQNESVGSPVAQIPRYEATTGGGGDSDETGITTAGSAEAGATEDVAAGATIIAGTAAGTTTAAGTAAGTTAAAGAGESISGGDAYEMIALSFLLPPGFAVSDVTQDRGQTVYTLREDKNDNIVITLEKTADNGGTGIFDEIALRDGGLRKININNTDLYAVAKPDYNYFTFENDGIIYGMTCKYDYRTIVSLCEYIL